MGLAAAAPPLERRRPTVLRASRDTSRHSDESVAEPSIQSLEKEENKSCGANLPDDLSRICES